MRNSLFNLVRYLGSVPSEFILNVGTELIKKLSLYYKFNSSRGKKHLHTPFFQRIASALLTFRHSMMAAPVTRSYLKCLFSCFFSTSPLSSKLLAACCDADSGLHWSQSLHYFLWAFCVPWHSGTMGSSCCIIDYLWKPLPWEDILSNPIFLQTGDLHKPHLNPELQLHWGVWGPITLPCCSHNTVSGCFYTPGLKLHFFVTHIFCTGLLKFFYLFPSAVSPLLVRRPSWALNTLTCFLIWFLSFSNTTIDGYLCLFQVEGY